MIKNSAFNHLKTRHFLGCVMALITAVVMIPGMTTYLPFALTEQILIPILLFPAIWTALFIYAYMAKNVWHPLGLMLAIILAHVYFSYSALTGA